MKSYFRTIIGPHHQQAGQVNQDAFACAILQDGMQLYLLADGIGSLPESHTAAQLCVSLFPRSLTISLQNSKSSIGRGALEPAEQSACVKWALKQTSGQLSQFLRPNQLGATTLTGAVISPNGAVLLFWLGDSPAFLLKSDEDLVPLTFPHNETAASLGLLNEDDFQAGELRTDRRTEQNRISLAPHSQSGHTLLRYLSGSADSAWKEQAETASFTTCLLNAGDTLLLGSDGVLQYLKDGAGLPGLSLDALGNYLMEQAEQENGQDDKTLIAVRI